MKRVISILFISIFLVNCATVPITGRKQLAVVPNAQIIPMSFDNYKQVLSESKLSNAVRMNFAEEKLSDVTVENNQINLTLAPHEIATIHLVF